MNTEPSIGFPGGSDGKESACNAGNLSSISGSGRSPGERNGNPPLYSCLEKSMDRAVWQTTASPWGCKESDTTKWLTHTHTQTFHRKWNSSLKLFLKEQRRVGAGRGRKGGRVWKRGYNSRKTKTPRKKKKKKHQGKREGR